MKRGEGDKDGGVVLLFSPSFLKRTEHTGHSNRGLAVGIVVQSGAYPEAGGDGWDVDMKM